MTNPLPPPTVFTALAVGDPPQQAVRVIPPKDSVVADTTYTLVLQDDGLWKRCTNAGAVTITVPPHSDVPFPNNTTIIVSQDGAGLVTVAAGAGVQINSAGGVSTTQAQYGVLYLFQNTQDVWTLYGYVPGTSLPAQTLFSQTASVTVANSVAETAITGTGAGTLTIPANFLTVGRSVKIWAVGFHSASGNPNITVKLKFGSTVMASTGVVSSGNSTASFWELRVLLTCRTTGATGTVMGQGFYEETAGGTNTFGMVNAAAITVDTTTTQAVTATVQWGTASSGNTLTCTNFVLETSSP